MLTTVTSIGPWPRSSARMRDSGAPAALRRSPAPESAAERFQKRLQATTEPGHTNYARAGHLLQEIYEDNALPLYQAAKQMLPAGDWQMIARTIAEQIELEDVQKLASYGDGRTVIRMVLRDAHADRAEQLKPSARRKKGYDSYISTRTTGGRSELPWTTWPSPRSCSS